MDSRRLLAYALIALMAAIIAALLIAYRRRRRAHDRVMRGHRPRHR